MAFTDKRSLISDSRDERRTEKHTRIAVNASKKGVLSEDVSELIGLPLNEIHKRKDGV
jgi:hypothetical protein